MQFQATCIITRTLLLVFLPWFLLQDKGCVLVLSASDVWDVDRCDDALKDWAAGALQELEEHQHATDRGLQELLFFLHIPRTGGRAYHRCLLTHLYSTKELCDRSYDKFRFNSSKHCRLLVSHDDYSVLTKLPMESTSVVTNMRHPTDRVFSAYEFSVGVAFRVLANEEKIARTSVPQKSYGVSRTLDIWPWNFLVPWMKDDLMRRQTQRAEGEDHTLLLGKVDISHYNVGAYIMPLHEFIQQPIVMDLVQNGATLQIAGLTNNSYMREARDLRKCVINFPSLGHHVLNVAKRRIERMLFVGLTDKHKDTAKLFAEVVGSQMFPLDADHGSVGSLESVTSKIHTNKFTSGFGLQKAPQLQNVTVDVLIDIYERCTSRLKILQVKQKMKHSKVARVNFSAEARQLVAKDILEDIRIMNTLDLDLYSHAQMLFTKNAAKGFNSRKTEVIKTYNLSTALSIDVESRSMSGQFAFVMFLCVCGMVTVVGGAWMIASPGKSKS